MDREAIQNNYNSIIPQLNPDLSIHSFGINYILAECNQHQLKLKREFQHIFDLVNGRNTVSDITQQYAAISNQAISEKFIYDLLYNDLASYGIVVSDNPVKKRKRELHLLLSFIFWKGKTLDAFSLIISPLFGFSFFYSSLTLMFSFIISVLLYFKYNNLSSAFELKNVAVYAVVSFIIVMFHELGHVAACTRYGAKHKGIGFGFYLFIPTFFADVSDAWRLSVKQRVIINMAGIYMEMIFVTIFFVIYLISKAEVMFYASTVLLISIVINLNPFVKYDGYWVLSDLTGVSNLSKQATDRLKQLFSKKTISSFSGKDIALLFYAIASYLMIAAFLFMLFFYDPQSIIRLPVKIWNTLCNYPSLLNINWDDFVKTVGRHLSPLLFYILVFRFMFTYLKKYLTTIKPAV